MGFAQFRRFAFLFVLLFTVFHSTAKEIIKLSDELIQIRRQGLLFVDSTSQLNWQEVLKISEKAWKSVEKDIPILGLSHFNFWYQLNVQNDKSVSDVYFLDINNPLIDSIDLYFIKENNLIQEFHTGDHYVFESRPLIANSFLFPITLQANEQAQILIRVRSEDQALLPISFGNQELMYQSKSRSELILGIYIGLMLVMFLYNTIIYFTTKDRSYLYYILYILSLLIAQIWLEGFGFKNFSPNLPALHHYGVVIFSTFTGLAAIAFARKFLNMKETAPLFNRGLYIFQGLYILASLCRVFGYNSLSFQLLDVTGGAVALYGLAFAIWLSIKGQRDAKFYLIAWLLFISGIIIYVLRNFGILPFNTFTSSGLQLGSAGEIILLSLALGDRINRLRREREAALDNSLRLAKENENIIKEQNVVLEQKVEERTFELQETNEELSVTLEHLKENQSQLIEAEKMASLGQLTAGIAHEINNPINFVTSNINPLKRDFLDLNNLMTIYRKLESSGSSDPESKAIIDEAIAFKNSIDYEYLVEEIDTLIGGIHVGAERTTEIVRGLRNFSRLDEDEFKSTKVEEGLESTLTLLNNRIKDKIDLSKKYADTPMIDCYPGKLNQVFMNILNNGIQAIELRSTKESNYKGKLTIQTEIVGEHIRILLGDNGVGMHSETQKKIFNPFFTTKEVGEGTGLGLSIVYKIIEKHNGNVHVSTELNKGTTFTITLPIQLEHFS